jgi:hypothetical protein
MRYDPTASSGRVAITLTQLIVAIISACAFVPAIGRASADELPAFRCPMPGTVITFIDGGSITFADQTGMTCQARSGKGDSVPQFLGLARAGSDLEKNHGERLFPLRVGNEIDFTSTGDSSHATGDIVSNTTTVYYQNNVKVVRQEKLVTAAGAFDTFVIEWHQQITGKISGAWLTTIWFAPDLGYRIKGKYETRQGYGNNTSYEVTSVTLPQGNGPPTATVAPTPSPSPQAPSPTRTVTPAPPAPPAAAVPNAPAASSSTAARLQALKDLLDRKLITPQEYEAKRKAILDAL